MRELSERQKNTYDADDRVLRYRSELPDTAGRIRAECFLLRHTETNDHVPERSSSVDVFVINHCRRSFRQNFDILEQRPVLNIVNINLSLIFKEQLFNVLLGTMSLVGPRPHEPEEVSRYTSQYKKLLNIKPGMTGAAQVSGRSKLLFEDEAKIDIYYIENWSLLEDIKILAKTPAAVINYKNVY
jgi:hypothetical protein